MGRGNLFVEIGGWEVGNGGSMEELMVFDIFFLVLGIYFLRYLFIFVVFICFGVG
jgi:hypothetical protein